MAPSPSPPFATRTCCSARTVPTTVPSIFTTPSVTSSPSTRMPGAITERPGSRWGAPAVGAVAAAARRAPRHHARFVQRPVGGDGRAAFVLSRLPRFPGGHRIGHAQRPSARRTRRNDVASPHGTHLLVPLFHLSQLRRQLADLPILRGEARALSLHAAAPRGGSHD